MEKEITTSGLLLSNEGTLLRVGWSRSPVWDCNLEEVQFYTLRLLQRFRIKKWDYYAIFTPTKFFSATIADLGYAGNVFVYTVDFKTHDVYEEGLIIPFSKGVLLPRNSTTGRSSYHDKRARLTFDVEKEGRNIKISWPEFRKGQGIEADISLSCFQQYESMNIVIPIGRKRFYYNRKINCMPASGYINFGNERQILDHNSCIGSLDWGRGVWEYSSYWNWASASGFLPDGRTIGLNLGAGFGNLTNAGENAIILQNKIHKVNQVKFDYRIGDYLKEWKFYDIERKVDIVFQPFCERVAKTNLAVIKSEVHQVFGRYSGIVKTDYGENIEFDNLVGFAEEHHAKW